MHIRSDLSSCCTSQRSVTLLRDTRISDPALCRHGNQLGIAYYDTHSSHLCVSEAQDGIRGSFAFLQLAVQHARPSSLHLPSSAGDAMIESARNAMFQLCAHTEERTQELVEDEPEQQTRSRDCNGVVLEKRSMFTTSSAKAMLESLIVDIDSDPSCTVPHPKGLSRLSALSARMSFDREQQVIAAGALLKVLLRLGLLTHTAPADFMDTSDAAPSVAIRNVKEVRIEHCLTLDASTHEALCIFNSERHPSNFIGGGRAKEGLSVFSTLNRCYTVQGKRLLRSWLARPILDTNTLEERFDAISYFSTRQHVMQALTHCIKGAKDIDLLLRKLGSTAELHTFSIWRDLLDTLSACLSVRDCIETQMRSDGTASVAKRVASLRRLLSCVNTTVLDMYETVSRVVDLNTSVDAADTGGKLVQDGLSEELDEKRRLFNELDEFLTEVAHAELRRIPPALESKAANLTLGVVYQVRSC